MKKLSVFCIVCLSILCAFNAVLADNYDIKITTTSEYHDEEETCFANITIPAVSGLREGMAYREINDELAGDGQALIEQYEKDKADLLTETDAANNPHFGYDYSYDIVTDNTDWLVLRTVQLFSAGSSSTVTKFYNFDKGTGILAASPEIDAETKSELAAYLKQEMEKKNLDEGSMYEIGWVDDALESVSESRHFYFNENNELVVFFDKYEVAPGAQGRSEFVIPDEILK